MPASKIQNESEVVRWFEEGRTYAWMIEEYRRKYHIETTPSMWGNFRRRHQLQRRKVRDDDLIPWAVKKEHRWLYPLAMLRHEARRRQGHPVAEIDERRRDAWLQMLKDESVVVHYDPDTEQGFFYVPRREEDDDIIRRPARKTTERSNADKN